MEEVNIANSSIMKPSNVVGQSSRQSVSARPSELGRQSSRISFSAGVSGKEKPPPPKRRGSVSSQQGQDVSPSRRGSVDITPNRRGSVDVTMNAASVKAAAATAADAIGRSSKINGGVGRRESNTFTTHVDEEGMRASIKDGTNTRESLKEQMNDSKLRSKAEIRRDSKYMNQLHEKRRSIREHELGREQDGYSTGYASDAAAAVAKQRRDSKVYVDDVIKAPKKEYLGFEKLDLGEPEAQRRSTIKK